MEPLAESPSVMKMAESRRGSASGSSSFFLLLGAGSLRWMRQSRSLRLWRLAFLARSRANFVTPAMALRSFSLSSIFLLQHIGNVGVHVQVVVDVFLDEIAHELVDADAREREGLPV